jgi:hypothetical protein
VSKYVAKFRKNKDYDDDYGYGEPKKRKKTYSDHRRMKNYRFEDFEYGQDGYLNTKKRKDREMY